MEGRIDGVAVCETPVVRLCRCLLPVYNSHVCGIKVIGTWTLKRWINSECYWLTIGPVAVSRQPPVCSLFSAGGLIDNKQCCL